MPEPEAYTPIGPITDPAAATAPTNAAPSADALMQGQQQAGKMYQLDPNYRPAQEPRNRPQLKQTGFLGNGQVATGQASGGDPLWAATLAAPTFQLDRSLDNIRQQKADIEKWMADATSQFKGRAADPYQKAYQDYVSAEHNKFFQDVADNYYNGDLSKAIEATRRDPELNRQFMNVNRSLGAIGDANKGGYDYYEKVDKAIRDGNAEVDPETQQLLEQGLNGEWAFNGQGPAHNAAQFDRLNDRLSMNKLFDQFYEKSAKDAGDKTESWSVQIDPKTKRKFLVVNGEKNYDEFVDAFVENAMKDAPYRDKDEVRRFVEARVPRENTVEVSQLSFPPSGGSSSTPADKVWIGRPDQAEGLVETVDKNGVKRRLPRSARISVGNIVDGRQEQFTKPASFKNGDKSVNMVWTGVEKADDGSIVLVGIDPGDVTTNAEADDIATEIGDLNSAIRDDAKYEPMASWDKYRNDEDGKLLKEDHDKWAAMMEGNKNRRSELLRKQSTTQKSKGEKTVPLKGNEGLADGLLGGRLQQAIGQLGGTRKESKPFIEPTKDANSPLSVYPDAKQEEDGTWYVIKDGKKKYLTRQ
jgi:hypothetical protein